MKAIDLKRSRNDIKKVVEQLSNESERNIMEVLMKLVRYLFQVADEDELAFLLRIILKFREND